MGMPPVQIALECSLNRTTTNEESDLSFIPHPWTMLNAIKEQQQQIREQRAQIQSELKQIKAQQHQIANLKSKVGIDAKLIAGPRPPSKSKRVSSSCPNLTSRQVGDSMALESGTVPKMSASTGQTPPFELIDAPTFSERLRLPESWVRAQSRNRVPVQHRIPHLKFGRYVRYEWGSPQLEAWLARHRE